MAKVSSSSSSSSQETAAKLKSLLKEIPKGDERADAARLDELRRLLASLIQQGDLCFGTAAAAAGNKNANSAATVKWNVWLQKQHKRTVQQLTDRIVKSGRRTAVRTLWGLIAASPQQTTNGNLQFVHSDLLLEWFSSIVAMPLSVLDITNDKSMQQLLEAELSQRDVQYYTLRCIARWAQEIFHQQQQQKKKAKKKKNNSEEQDDEEDDSKKKKLSTVSIQEQSDRMLHILMMIPFPTTQSALQNPSSNKYLFPPPPKESSSSSSTKNAYEDQEDSSDSSDSDDDDDDDDNNSVKDDDEEDSSDDDDGPPTKKRRKEDEAKKKNNNNNNNKQFAYQDIKYHLGALSKAWIAILRLPLSNTALKKALPFLSSHVLPKVRRPLEFADLYMQAFNNKGAAGGGGQHSSSSSVIPLLALDGLFFLMTQHQLEYPQFYTQLYTLLNPKLFYVKYRTRFYELLQKCLLRNEMLPAHLVAAFLKRLLRNALQAPPGGTIFVLALSSNLLRQHEECAALIHREESTTTELDDPYDVETDDPVKSNAIQSSLWELNALEHHYLPAVATLAQSIGREDPKSPMLQLDEMASHTYTSLIEQERKRKLKTPKKRNTYDKNAKPTTPVTFVKPSGLFTSQDVFAGMLNVPSTTTTTTATTSS